MSAKRYERYQRQILLKEFGVAAQEKLLQAKALVIGAGGLGCPVLQYLAAAGVGEIGIVDDDIVTLTNMNRQVLYGMNDTGLSKARVAAEKLKLLNDEISIITYNLRLTNKNAFGIMREYHIVIDGTDNFSSRYMINDACVLLNKPLVYGAISRFEGQVAVFNIKTHPNARPTNYRDLFPTPPKDNEVMNCAESGVLGVLPGIIGTMQANEAIKLITGTGVCLIDKLLTYNALTNSMYELHLCGNEQAQQSIPKDEEAFLEMNYHRLCSSPITGDLEIDATAFNKLVLDNNTTIIDVREKDEQPVIDEFKCLQIPLSELVQQQPLIKADTIVVFCQSGERSLHAARVLSETYTESKKIYTLKGGIVEWKRRYALHEA